jgi:hypothetical protein
VSGLENAALTDRVRSLADGTRGKRSGLDLIRTARVRRQGCRRATSSILTWRRSGTPIASLVAMENVAQSSTEPPLLNRELDIAPSYSQP